MNENIITPAELRAVLSEFEKSEREQAKYRRSKRIMTTFSKWVMAAVMMMFFVGVAIGVYATLFLGEPVSTTLNYIMRLSFVVGLGYFVKAFGENIARIVFSARVSNVVLDD